MSYVPSACRLRSGGGDGRPWPTKPLSRCLDLAGAGFGLLVLSPLLLTLAVAVRLTSPGPALFRSTRIGRNARPFTLYKFRSMIDGSPDAGPAITTAGDPRVTDIGKTLRRLSSTNCRSCSMSFGGK